MLHDTYAYGVLLLEIGLWQLVLEHRYIQGLVKDVQDLKPEQIQEVLVKIAKQSLGHTMGTDYRDAAVLYLEEDDYRTQPRCMQTFRIQVLDHIQGS